MTGEASASVAASPALRRDGQCLGHPQLEYLDVLFPSADLNHQPEEEDEHNTVNKPFLTSTGLMVGALRREHR